MGNFIKVTKTSDIPDNSMKSFTVSGKKINVINREGEFFALDDKCTHMGCSLGEEGFLEEEKITCGCHGAQFAVKSGKVLAPPAETNLKSYQTKVDNGELFIEI